MLWHSIAAASSILFLGICGMACGSAEEDPVGDDEASALEPPDLEPQGHGCPWEPDVCNFHCVYEVVHPNAGKPTGGVCGGPAGFVCYCLYD